MRLSASYACAFVCALLTLQPLSAAAEDIHLGAGDNLQAALDAAQGGDTIYLAPGATYSGNFKLRAHGGTRYVTLRTEPSGDLLPPAGVRITPAHSRYLAKIVSPNDKPAIRTLAGAGYWRLMLLEIGPTANPATAIVDLGDGSAAQNQLAQVPHHLILERLYVHGSALLGQKRGIGLNSGATTIRDSHVDEIKAIGMDTQAIGGWNGPGPYTIENNHLEAGAEVIMFGGDDPKIPGLVPSDIIVRRNTLTRPLAWRDPILAPPQGTRVSFSGGGTLPAGTYAYRVVARRVIGSTLVRSTPAAEVTITVPAGARAVIEWSAVPDATEYLVYGRNSGTQTQYWRVTTTSLTDSGAPGSSGSPSNSPSLWQVKNIFELKNARRVTVEHNVLEHNWAQAQNGTAVLFTPRNQYGDCTWCVVEDVTFEQNVVRDIGAAFLVLGFDNLNPTRQTRDIRIRHNEISGLNKTAWGGSGYLATITGGPRDVVIDHNTIASPSGGGLVMAEGPPISGFVFTNNVARHNSYGMIGTGQKPGNATLAHYFPGAIVRANVLAGGTASAYPTGNLFPSLADFEAHFVDYAAGVLALKPATNWAGAGTDSLDLGRIADTASAPEDDDAIRIGTTAIDDVAEGEPIDVSLSVSGGLAPYEWAVADGALPAGVMLDAFGATLTGAAGAPGTFAFTLRVTDAFGETVTQPLSLTINSNIPPIDLHTESVTGGVATIPYAQVFDATGGHGTYTWLVTEGALPAGLALSAAGVLSGSPLQAGTYTFTLTVLDASDASRSDSAVFTLSIVEPPNQAPELSLQPITMPVLVGATLQLAVTASDADGVVARVDFYLGNAKIGSATGSAFSLPWQVTAPGTYELSAVAIDDDGAETVSAPVVVTTRSEIVLYAADVTRTAGTYTLIADPSAAGGVALQNTDLGAAKVSAALAAPVNHAEFTFHAEAGRPYRLWIRARALKNSWANDSAFVQFSGVAAARIGTRSAVEFNLESGLNAGVSGWGWEDNGWGLGVLGPAIVFETTGQQTLRIQPREDGLVIDQIVLSPEQYLLIAPGLDKNDQTIVGR